MNFYMPTKLVGGVDCIRTHAHLIAQTGTRCLLVTSASAAKRCGALDDVTAVLDRLGIPWEIYDRIRANPTIASCMEAAEMARQFGADFLMGIGGGSALDAAKIAAIAAANPEIDAEGLYAKQWSCRRLPLILVGTTAGTGSEVTPVAVMTDDAGRKRGIRDEMVYADLSFGDPKYTYSLPRSVTVSTAVDAVCHCMESYFNRQANPISRGFALQGMELLLPPLRHLTEHDDLSSRQRQDLYHGSILGGLAISVTGTTFPHNMGYYFSEEHGIPHGHACALFLPNLLDHVAACAPRDTELFFQTLGTTAEELLQLVNTLLPLPSIRLSEETIAALLPRWENNVSVMNTMGTITTDYLRGVLLEKFG